MINIIPNAFSFEIVFISRYSSYFMKCFLIFYFDVNKILYLDSNKRQTRDSKMNAQKPEKKVVGRTVAIGLGIICIVLVVILVGAIADYTSIISGKDTSISSQASQILSLQKQVSNLTDTVNLSQLKNWVSNQPVSISASGYTSWAFSASYAGYVFVSVQTNRVMGLYFRVIYHSPYLNYDHQIGNNTYSTSIGSFPILPSTNIQIIVGTNSPNGMTGNVTITYSY